MVDPTNNGIRNDARINWICNPEHKHREMRGLTAAGRSGRGLNGKGNKNKNQRPSVGASWKRRHT